MSVVDCGERGLTKDVRVDHAVGIDCKKCCIKVPVEFPPRPTHLQLCFQKHPTRVSYQQFHDVFRQLYSIFNGTFSKVTSQSVQSRSYFTTHYALPNHFILSKQTTPSLTGAPSGDDHCSRKLSVVIIHRVSGETNRSYLVRKLYRCCCFDECKVIRHLWRAVLIEERVHDFTFDRISPCRCYVFAFPFTTIPSRADGSLALKS